MTVTVAHGVDWPKLIRKAMWEFEREYALRPTEIYLPYEIERDVMVTFEKYQFGPPYFLFGMKLAIHDGPVMLVARRPQGGGEWVIRWTISGFDEAYLFDGRAVVDRRGRNTDRA